LAVGEYVVGDVGTSTVFRRVAAEQSAEAKALTEDSAVAELAVAKLAASFHV
jgi:hypothetical protein